MKVTHYDDGGEALACVYSSCRGSTEVIITHLKGRRIWRVWSQDGKSFEAFGDEVDAARYASEQVEAHDAIQILTRE